MIISRAEIESAVSAYRTSRKKKAQAPQTFSFDTSDAYVSSSEAAGLVDLAANVAAEPLYRQGLVSDLHQRVADGKYYVPAELIVEKLLGRLVLQSLPA